MNKKILVLIIVVGVLGLFLLSWIFNKDDKTPTEQTTPPPVTNDPPSQQEIEAKGNVNNDQLTKDQNASIKAFAREFTKKYLSYNPSKPQGHIESLKDVMAPNLYAQQMAENQKPSATKKSIQIKKIYITDIIVGNQYTSLIVPVDATLTTTDNQQVDLTYAYRYDIVPNNNGWKVVWITDATDLGQ